MAITPLQIFRPQNGGISQLLASGQGTLSSALNNIVQVGRGLADKQLAQERDFLSERKRNDDLAQRRVENQRKADVVDRGFDRGVFEADRLFAFNEEEALRRQENFELKEGSLAAERIDTREIRNAELKAREARTEFEREKFTAELDELKREQKREEASRAMRAGIFGATEATEGTPSTSGSAVGPDISDAFDAPAETGAFTAADAFGPVEPVDLDDRALGAVFPVTPGTPGTPGTTGEFPDTSKMPPEEAQEIADAGIKSAEETGNVELGRAAYLAKAEALGRLGQVERDAEAEKARLAGTREGRLQSQGDARIEQGQQKINQTQERLDNDISIDSKKFDLEQKKFIEDVRQFDEKMANDLVAGSGERAKARAANQKAALGDVKVFTSNNNAFPKQAPSVAQATKLAEDYPDVYKLYGNAEAADRDTALFEVGAALGATSRAAYIEKVTGLNAQEKSLRGRVYDVAQRLYGDPGKASTAAPAAPEGGGAAPATPAKTPQEIFDDLNAS